MIIAPVAGGSSDVRFWIHGLQIDLHLLLAPNRIPEHWVPARQKHFRVMKCFVRPQHLPVPCSVQYKQIVLDGKFAQFSGLHRHYDQCPFTAFISEFTPSIHCSLSGGIIFHLIPRFSQKYSLSRISTIMEL